MIIGYNIIHPIRFLVLALALAKSIYILVLAFSVP